MRNDIDNNQYDDFSERIRQGLANHQMPVDGECWNEIEIRIKSENRRKKGWQILAPIAAAAIVLLLFLAYPITENENLEPIISFKIEEKVTDQPEKREYTVPINSFKEKTNSFKNVSQNTESADRDVSKAENIDKESPDTELEKEQYTEKENKQPQKEKKEEKTLIENKTGAVLLSKRKKEEKWMLAAAIGSGNNLPKSNNYEYAPMYMDGSVVSSPPSIYTKNDILSPNDFSDITHNVPLSFGITARKNINNNFAVESGLIYTYLSSSFSKPGSPRYTAKSYLHYLGVPLNLIAYVHRTPKWNVYIGGGGMVEKGLQLVYNQSIYRDNNTSIDTSVRKNVEGLQWSLNGLIGVSYTFYENWSFYFEPRVSYYFDNNQPISIRTEESFIIGLNGGLRYEF